MKTYLLLFILFLHTCLCAQDKTVTKLIEQTTILSVAPQYDNLFYWAAHPYKKDLSDSVPASLQDGRLADTTIDVFFIHPTTYTNYAERYVSNASILDSQLNQKTDYSTILYQASVFNKAGRVFAPRYRQAHYQSYFPKTKEDSLVSWQAFDLAYQDVKNAFLYYLEHYNNGRPFIIAAHSQGTTHGKKLLKELIDNKPLKDKMVAAYLVGMAVEEDYYTTIPACTTPAQTGCIISWRTFKEGYLPDYVKRETKKAIVTNPLSWDTSTAAVSNLFNQGAILRNFNKVIPKTAGARIASNVIWTNKPKFFGSVLLQSRNYHIADINLYYVDIQKNLQQRINAYKSKNHSP